MLGPNHHTFHLANEAYDKRVQHAARIQAIKQDREDGTQPVNLEGHRFITARRLAAAGLAGFVLTAAIAAGGAGIAAASPNHASGGGTIQVR